jgi:hypothetical protein
LRIVRFPPFKARTAFARIVRRCRKSFRQLGLSFTPITFV